MSPIANDGTSNETYAPTIMRAVPDEHHQQVALPGRGALAQPDGDQEVAEGQATLERRHAAQTGRDHGGDASSQRPGRGGRPGAPALPVVRQPVPDRERQATQVQLVELELQLVLARIEAPAGDVERDHVPAAEGHRGAVGPTSVAW